MDKTTTAGILLVCGGMLLIMGMIAIDQNVDGAYIKYYTFEHPYEHHDDFIIGYYYNPMEFNESGNFTGQYIRIFNPDNEIVTYENINVTAIRDGPWSIIPSPEHLHNAIDNRKTGRILVGDKMASDDGRFYLQDKELFIFEYNRESIEALRQEMQGMKQTIIDLEYDIAKLQKQN